MVFVYDLTIKNSVHELGGRICSRIVEIETLGRPKIIWLRLHDRDFLGHSDGCL